MIERLTGARPSEQTRVLACFGSLFCLLASYYLIKPLRNSQFLREFLPESLPFYYLLVSALSLAATRVFRRFYEKLSKPRLLVSTFSIICLLKVLFFLWLPTGGKEVSIAFYLFASIYFLLALAVTWGCVNQIFDAEQGERCFGFVATGSTLGCIAGSEIASHLAGAGSLSLLVSAAFMMISLALILMARRGQSNSPPIPLVAQGNWSEFVEVGRDRYLRSLAIMVVGLAIYSTGVDFISQKQMDRRLAESEYQKCFFALNRELGSSPNSGFEFVYALRKTAPEDVEKALQSFAGDHSLSPAVASALPHSYQTYRQQLNLRTRLFFSDTFYYQGVFGALFLVVLLRGFFRSLKVRGTALLLPVFSLLSLAIFSAPLSLEAVQVLLVVGGTLNYAVNNATKEVLYTVASTDAKFKVKPLIEGPGMRAGDVIASLVSLLCAYLVTLLGLPASLKDQLYLVFCGLCVVLWLHEINWAGRHYETRK